ncbi:MAG: hypothetical protein U9N34_07690 [Candidatus Cloacimonadota bacterium]|nr:hypothetical protein [Candidatus Cloacimonadota bacterium]
MSKTIIIIEIAILIIFILVLGLDTSFTTYICIEKGVLYSVGGEVASTGDYVVGENYTLKYVTLFGKLISAKGEF